MAGTIDFKAGDALTLLDNSLVWVASEEVAPLPVPAPEQCCAAAGAARLTRRGCRGVQDGWLKGRIVRKPSPGVVEVEVVARDHAPEDPAGARLEAPVSALLPWSELDANEEATKIGDVLNLQVLPPPFPFPSTRLSASVCAAAAATDQFLRVTLCLPLFLSVQVLHDAAVFETLRMRYFNDSIYTQAGPTSLISINPYKQIVPLYTQRAINTYKDNTQGAPPHVFAMAQAAYNNLCDDGVCQSILCSGESGAGKTEVAKLVVQFLAATTSKDAAFKGAGGSKARPPTPDPQPPRVCAPFAARGRAPDAAPRPHPAPCCAAGSDCGVLRLTADCSVFDGWLLSH
jgi:hypothetical protein